MTEIVVSGYGAISAIGNSVDEMFDSLKEGRHGIRQISILETKMADSFLAGEVKLSNVDLKASTGLKNIQSRTTLLAAVALKEAINSADLSTHELSNTAFISSTTVGGMDQTERYYQDFKKGKNREFAKVHPSGEHSNRLADLFGLKAHVSTVSTACSSASNAMIIGARMIKSGEFDRVIVGGVDALAKFTMNGFNSLLILDPNHCKPFDANRKGLNLGEAAAYLVIESQASAKRRSVKIHAVLNGYANVNEAFHQTASSPNGDGAFSAMAKTLKMAKLNVEDVDYINAHGTGTDNNDSSESMAINRLFKGSEVKFSSTKAFTGHTLAASGGVEAIISVLCLENDFIPANLNFINGIDGAEIKPVPIASMGKSSINHVLSNSFGFGGNNTSVLFSKYRTA